MYGLRQGSAIGSWISIDSLGETPQIKTNLVRIHTTITAKIVIPEYPQFRIKYGMSDRKQELNKLLKGLM